MSDLRLELRDRISAVLDAELSPDAPLALIGGCLHPNVGDSAIMLGTFEYLRGRGIEPAYFCQGDRDYSARALSRRLGRGGTVLLRGGGSFNDLWPGHQDFRERVWADHPRLRTIELPQSIFFSQPAAAGRAARAIDAHRNLLLLVRDRASLGRADELGASARLCPDMALFLGPRVRPVPPSGRPLVLGRTDLESAVDWEAGGLGDAERADWIGVGAAHGLGPRAVTRLARGLGAERLDALRSRLMLGAQRRFSRSEMARGEQMLSRGEVVVTDRLHGHILCLMLGIPHVVLDNRDGKALAFVDTWTRDSPLVRTATTPERALALAREAAP